MNTRLQKFSQLMGIDYNLVKNCDDQSAEKFIKECSEEFYAANGWVIVEENGRFIVKCAQQS